MDDFTHFFEHVMGVERLKWRGDQGTGLCPFHDDKSPSFSVNKSNGVYNCFSCGKKGHAYEYAKEHNLDNPRQYLTNDIHTPQEYIPVNTIKAHTKQNMELTEKAKQYHSIIPKDMVDNIPFLSDMLVGINNKRYTFPYFDENGMVVGIKHHKGKNGESPYWIGDGTCKWYGLQFLKEYDPDKTLYICEGEKDFFLMKTVGHQVTTGSAGAGSIPDDISAIAGFKDYIIIYDNDTAGYNGAEKLAERIKKEFGSIVKIAQWREGLPDGYDIYEDGKQFPDEVDHAIVNAKEYKLEIPKELGVFQIMTGSEASETTPKPTEMIIDTILPKDFNTILAGTTGCNKSYFAMQMGMSLANDQEHFLEWKIMKKGLKVLYVDTEAGMTECHRRFKRIACNINFQNNERFMLISKEGIHADIWTDLQAMININKPDIVIIDCLYNSSIERNISKGYNVAKLTDQLTLLKSKYGVHVFAVHHFNKYEHEKGLITDRMAGAGALQNWVEHLILITESNETDFRLMRLGKSRGIYYSSQYYGIEWDAEKQWLTMKGIVSNVNALLVDDNKKKKWIEALDRMPEEIFETKDWRNVVECEWKYSESTAKKWLKQLMHCEMIEKTAHGIYRKKLKLIDDEIDQ